MSRLPGIQGGICASCHCFLHVGQLTLRPKQTGLYKPTFGSLPGPTLCSTLSQILASHVHAYVALPFYSHMGFGGGSFTDTKGASHLRHKGVNIPL